MHLGPLTDLYGTPGAPKRAHFGPEWPFWGPRRSSEGPGGPDLVPTASHWPVWVGLMVTTHFDLVSAPSGPLGTLKGPVSATKCPFWGPRRAPRGQIWSRLPPIGPPGLDSCSPHTLTRYRAPSGPLGVLKGPVFARNAPFGALGGPRRAPRDQVWSRLPPIGPPRMDSCSPHTLTWYRAPSGSPGGQKGLFGPDT